MEKKGALEVSFAWMFAIIVGATILFLTIFGVSKFISTEQATSDVKAGKEIGVLLNPLEIGFESAKTTTLTMPVETRIFNLCDPFGEFGRQGIEISQKTFNKWSETGIDVGFQNKYIFSNKFVEGKNFLLFSKPFEFPFKVADVIYMTSSTESYCFIDAPEEIGEEIEDLNQANLFISDCPQETIEVCFGFDSSCDINVNYNLEYVEKLGIRSYFESDSLMYAAIFSDGEIYECQVQRLMSRTSNLAELYSGKSLIIAEQGCVPEMAANLIFLKNLAESLDSSRDLFQLKSVVENLENSNELARCSLW